MASITPLAAWVDDDVSHRGGKVRRLLLWAARNRWLKDHLPRMWFMRRAVRRFMPGETLAEALGAAAPLQAVGIRTIYTRLGENLEQLSEADEVAAHYLDAYDQFVAAGIDGEVSVKPTQLGLDLDEEACFGHLVRLAERAAERNSYLWIDMEGSPYVDPTLRLYERLRAVQPRTGICLQAYLHRTAADIERLRPLDPAIRLVKGAYDEPSSIAYTNRRSVDASYLGLAVGFLTEGRGRPIRLGLGTHDVALIEQIAEQVAAVGINKDAFEVEMLYGIREDQQRRMAAEGYRVQSLIAYGEHWYPWYMRRLAERPANVVFAMRQLIP
jgi:proline dehydrogenase